jgi:SAM-dependent methyltransferase
MGSHSSGTFNTYQYEDLLNRSQDLYANTKYEIIMTYLAGHKELSILNVGCGSGELCFLLAKAGHRVLGIDPGPEYIELARANARRCGDKNCEFRVSFIEDMPAERTFDCVMATDVLEHIQDDRCAFEKMIQLVRPGGIVIVTVPAGQWLFGYHDETIGHYRRYSLRTLRKLASPRCRIDHMRYFGFSLIPVCYLYSKLLRKPYPVTEVGGSAKSSLAACFLRSLLRLEKLIPMPLGTSLLMKARRTPCIQIGSAQGRMAARDGISQEPYSLSA